MKKYAAAYEEEEMDVRTPDESDADEESAEEESEEEEESKGKKVICSSSVSILKSPITIFSLQQCVCWFVHVKISDHSAPCKLDKLP